MIEVTVVGWTATLAVIVALLAVDWRAFGRRTHTIAAHGHGWFPMLATPA